MNQPTTAHEPVFAFRPGEQEALPARLQKHAAALARLVVAVDGPAGSGKSSTARAVAERLGLVFLDTGAMYRALTLLAQRRHVDPSDGEALVALVRGHRIGFESGPSEPRVHLDGEDVAAAIRAPEVTAAVSRVAAHAEVRREMVRQQRQIGAAGGVILDGRDIGTVVFPDADVKVFVTADVPTRARRRQREDAGRGIEQTLEALEVDIRRRDAEDSSRSASPLARAADAVWLDTTGLEFSVQVDAILALAVRAVREQGAPRVRSTTRRGSEPADPAAAPPPGRLARLVPANLEAARQSGYRPWHSRLHHLVRNLIVLAARGVLGQRTYVHPAARLQGSALVACNHIAGLDPPICGASAPFECWYIAKLELFRNPALRRLIERFNAIPIHRGTADFSALDRAVERLQSGRNVFMFPEGTRQKPGRLGAAKWGFGYVASRAGRPVIPMFVRGTRDGRPRGWRRQPLEVWVGEPVEIQAVPGADPHALHRQVGELVMERIAGLMLRSAAATPLSELSLPGAWAAAPTVPTRASEPTTDDPGKSPA